MPQDLNVLPQPRRFLQDFSPRGLGIEQSSASTLVEAELVKLQDRNSRALAKSGFDAS